jgi:hypothetical protein
MHGHYKGGLIRRMPSKSLMVHVSSLRANIDTVVYLMSDAVVRMLLESEPDKSNS